MKYVIINGSPRKKNTWKVVKQVKKNLKGEFKEIHLMKENIPFCAGCYKCFYDGEEKCPHFEQVNPLVEKLQWADAIIVASPIYAMNVTALLKNFIDHTAYFYHRPEFFTKKGLVIVTTAGAGQKDGAKYIDETMRHWGVNKVYRLAFACGGKDELEVKKIDKVAKEFGEDVESRKLHSPKLMDIVFYNVWKAMALTEDAMGADKKYWCETGLVNHDFAPEVKLSIFKKIFSKIMIRIFKRVF